MSESTTPAAVECVLTFAELSALLRLADAKYLEGLLLADASMATSYRDLDQRRAGLESLIERELASIDGDEIVISEALLPILLAMTSWAGGVKLVLEREDGDVVVCVARGENSALLLELQGGDQALATVIPTAHGFAKRVAAMAGLLLPESELELQRMTLVDSERIVKYTVQNRDEALKVHYPGSETYADYTQALHEDLLTDFFDEGSVN